ncbi:MAG TPA: hypothetical protein VK879_06620 [Candidatus Sulfomarinibacteraceae bacterium]|nr:hypothetical protein [Candidatus Sulfomarinibacteraceae bacterium]
MSTTGDSGKGPLHQEISRRSFIQATGSGLVVSLLAACGAEAPTAEGEPTTAEDGAASQSTEKTFACATCKTRMKAEENPRSVSARLWRWHTGWCPGWKEYQTYLANQK